MAQRLTPLAVRLSIGIFAACEKPPRERIARGLRMLLFETYSARFTRGQSLPEECAAKEPAVEDYRLIGFNHRGHTWIGERFGDLTIARG